MCILFVYTNPNVQKDTFRLVLISNRDEYFQRPAQSIQYLKDEEIVGGFDMEPGREGGMWLGLSTKKSNSFKLRIGVLLNIAAGQTTNAKCKDRGSIVRNYLNGDLTADDYIKFLSSNGPYKPHHFVAAELSNNHKSVTHSSNSPTELHKFSGSDCLGFGNSPVDTPYKKVEAGCKQFQEIMDAYNNTEQKEELIKKLVELLKWEQKHLPDPELEKRNKAFNEFLSSIFVRSPEYPYGTRAHSIILVDYDWNLEFIEIAMEQPIDVNNPTWTARSVNLKL